MRKQRALNDERLHVYCKYIQCPIQTTVRLDILPDTLRMEWTVPRRQRSGQL